MGRNQIIYHTCGLYISTPFFDMVYIVEQLLIDSLGTKQGNSSMFEPKIHGLYSTAVSNQERVIMARVKYI
jgi:hypothetical protein